MATMNESAEIVQNRHSRNIARLEENPNGPLSSSLKQQIATDERWLRDRGLLPDPQLQS